MKLTKLGIAAAAAGVLALLGGCASGPDLKSTVWTPVKLENQGGVGLIQDRPVWFRISEENKISGNGGVNSILGTTTEVGESTLVFAKLATTRKAGPNLEYENLFLKALDETRTYQIEGENLRLYDKNGELLATFAVGPQTFFQGAE